MTSTLYVIAAVLIVIAIVLLVLLGASAAMAALLGLGAVASWLVPRAARLARRVVAVAGRTVRDVREPSGRHRRIGDLPAPSGRKTPRRPDGPPPGHVWKAPEHDPHAATQPIPRAEEAAA